jgi:hypothetical protein
MNNEKQISFNNAEDRSQVAAQALGDPEILAALVENLSSDQRRIRQFSAAAIKEAASQDPKDRKSTRLNSSHSTRSRMPSSA